MNTELYKNAEGYTDTTAAATLSRKEPGDIWEYKGGECLIIKGHTGIATILKLHDNNQYGDRILVTTFGDGPRYVDPTFIITGRYVEMGQYIETLDVETFERVIDAVEDALAISLPCAKSSNTTVEPVGNDPVNHPTHYTSGGVECIDAIRASMTPEEFKGYLKGNAMKYLWRYQLKGKPQQDLEKAGWYLSLLSATVES